MNAVTAPSTADDAAVLQRAHSRLNMAARAYGLLGVTGPLRAWALIDAPGLISVAERGVQARIQLDPLAGISIRAEQVRDLHDGFEFGGGLIVCVHCSSLTKGPVIFPCVTRQALDGLDAP